MKAMFKTVRSISRSIFAPRSIVGAVERAIKTTSDFAFSSSFSVFLFFFIRPVYAVPKDFIVFVLEQSKCHAQVSLRIQVSLKARQHNICDFFIM